MKSNEFVTELNIDNDKGWGQTPNNANVSYAGALVLMKPSVFLRLSYELPLDDSAKKKIEAMKKHAQSGGGFGAPTLYVDIPRAWEDGEIVGTARIRGHEGRHRMNVQLELEGDIPVETHIFISGFKNRNWAKDYKSDYTPEIMNTLNTTIKSERGQIMSGPFFKI